MHRNTLTIPIADIAGCQQAVTIQELNRAAIRRKVQSGLRSKFMDDVWSPQLWWETTGRTPVFPDPQKWTKKHHKSNHLFFIFYTIWNMSLILYNIDVTTYILYIYNIHYIFTHLNQKILEWYWGPASFKPRQPRRLGTNHSCVFLQLFKIWSNY